MRRWRHYAAVVFFLVASSGLGARVVYLNVSERAFLQEQGDARSVRTETISAYRGVVYDRSGEPLALSTPVVAVWVDPSQRKLTDAGVSQIARTLGLDARRLSARLARNPENEFLYPMRAASW